MSAVSLREKRLLVVTVLVVLYAVAGFTARKRLAAWADLRDDAALAQTELMRREATIARSDEWTQRYLDVRALMPVFAADVNLQTHWLKILDDIAKANGLATSNTRLTSDKPVGDINEATIDCGDWKGSLENLLHFLHDLHLAGVMLDIRKLHIRPESRNPGALSGQFTLSCAYMRETPPAQTPNPQVSKSQNP